MTPESDIGTRLLRALAGDDRCMAERKRLVRLMTLFAELPPPPDPLRLFGQYTEHLHRFLAATHGSDGEAIEEAFLGLYCHLHGHEAPYTASERRRVDETGGYWSHAGGVSPLVKAAPYIQASTVSADFGAGNGLQGLLLQKLYPHARTVQIEISSRMIEAGRHLQEWLGIGRDRVEWRACDIFDVMPEGVDFIYLYRPVRPEGEGARFYTRFAETLAAADHKITIFSVADCLRPFLSRRFEVFYSDGHLTCYRRAPG